MIYLFVKYYSKLYINNYLDKNNILFGKLKINIK